MPLQCWKPNLNHLPWCTIPMVTPGLLRHPCACPCDHHMLCGQTITLPKSRFTDHWTGRRLNNLGLPVYITLLFFHTCMKETHWRALPHVVLMNMLDKRSKRHQQHLAVWTAKQGRSRRDDTWKPLLKSLCGSLQFFSLSWKERAGFNTVVECDWFCCLAYITHLILPPSLVNCSLQPSSLISI